MSQQQTVRIAAVGDLHCRKSSTGKLQPLFSQVAHAADVVVLCGDLCDYGTPEEAQILVKELSSLGRIPIVAVLGNHDFEGGKQEEIKKILADSGINVLDGESVEILGIGFAGVKGFCGGFDERALGPWGEDMVKRFVREALEEALRLESALARLRTPNRVAVLHYSPIKATVVGEPPEIYPFVGSSRLEEPLTRNPVTVVFHGHAHKGSPEGKLSNGTPVYNVALPLMQRLFPEQPPFKIFEVQSAA